MFVLIGRGSGRPAGSPLRLIAEVKLPRRRRARRRARSVYRSMRCATHRTAPMVSVLTDGTFFGGCFEDLVECRDALDQALGARRPRLLCKEFVLESVQIDRAIGAG